MELLDRLEYMKAAYYASDRITLVVMVTDTIAHLALFAALFGLVYSQRRLRSGGK